MNLDFVKSPWVIGGAGLLIGLLFLSRMGSSGGSSNSGVSYANASLALVSQEAQQSSQIEMAKIAASADITDNVASTIGNLVNAHYAYRLGSEQVTAGVTSNRIAANTALQLEKINSRVTIHGQDIGKALGLATLLNNFNMLKEHDKAVQKQQDSKQSNDLIKSVLGGFGL